MHGAGQAIGEIDYLSANVINQVIRENPASRGSETSAEVLVGPPWRMWFIETNATAIYGSFTATEAGRAPCLRLPCAILLARRPHAVYAYTAQ